MGDDAYVINCKTDTGKKFSVFVDKRGMLPFFMKRNEIADIPIHEIQKTILDTFFKEDAVYDEKKPNEFPIEGVTLKTVVNFKDEKGETYRTEEYMNDYYSFLCVVQPTIDINEEYKKEYKDDVVFIYANMGWMMDVQMQIDRGAVVEVDKRSKMSVDYFNEKMEEAKKLIQARKSQTS